MSNVNTWEAFGAQTAFGSVANLNGLAIASACALGGVDSTSFTPGVLGFQIDFSIPLAATGVSAAGYVTAYLIASATSTSAGFTDGITPGGASVASALKNARPVYQGAANANGQVVADTFVLPVVWPPRYWTLVWLNGTAAAFGTGCACNYTPLYETTG
jgi:hypothetical protein